MEKKELYKYVGRKVFLMLTSGFKYKFDLEEEFIGENGLSFDDKFGNPVNFDFSAINFITISRDDRGVQNG